MKKNIPILLVMTLLLSLSVINQSIADELENICDMFIQKLKTVKGGSVTEGYGEFTDHYGATIHKGCIMKLAGDSTKVEGRFNPHDLFYPDKGSALFNLGWRADREADGPDGTSFRIFKDDIFCLLRAQWDGGDDSNPEYIPSSYFEVSIKCGKLQAP